MMIKNNNKISATRRTYNGEELFWILIEMNYPHHVILKPVFLAMSLQIVSAVSIRNIKAIGIVLFVQGIFSKNVGRFS